VGTACAIGAGRGFDHVTISCCLLMVDEPPAAIRAATSALRPGGTLHVVDFGDISRLPRWFAALMRAWLARFLVRHRPEIAQPLRQIAQRRDSNFGETEIAGRYVLVHRLRLPAD
jgi:S-adenosylmethionine-diacylgycerolhomoserine-N-methlytransferase